MRIELNEITWLDEHRELTLAELAELSGLSEAELRALEDCGAIAPIDPASKGFTTNSRASGTLKLASCWSGTCEP